MRMTLRIVMKSLISESRNASTAKRNTIIPMLVRMIPKRIISIVMGVFRLSFTTTRVLFVSYYWKKSGYQKQSVEDQGIQPTFVSLVGRWAEWWLWREKASLPESKIHRRKLVVHKEAKEKGVYWVCKPVIRSTTHWEANPEQFQE